MPRTWIKYKNHKVINKSASNIEIITCQQKQNIQGLELWNYYQTQIGKYWSNLENELRQEGWSLEIASLI